MSLTTQSGPTVIPDLGRVLGEAIYLLESREIARHEGRRVNLVEYFQEGRLGACESELRAYLDIRVAGPRTWSDRSFVPHRAVGGQAGNAPRSVPRSRGAEELRSVSFGRRCTGLPPACRVSPCR